MFSDAFVPAQTILISNHIFSWFLVSISCLLWGFLALAYNPIVKAIMFIALSNMLPILHNIAHLCVFWTQHSHNRLFTCSSMLEISCWNKNGDTCRINLPTKSMNVSFNFLFLFVDETRMIWITLPCLHTPWEMKKLTLLIALCL
jgi:hypothetical protein